MRPTTLDEAYSRMLAGEPHDKVYAEFLDHFYGLPDSETRAEALAAEPRLTGDVRLDALAAATASYLGKKYKTRVPGWTAGPARYLREPWFTTDLPEPGIKAFLWHSSPAEFRSRNIFTEARPFRRASQDLKRPSEKDGPPS